MSQIPTNKMLQSLAKKSIEEQQEFIENIYFDEYDYWSLVQFGVRVELMPFFSMRNQLIRIIQKHKAERNRLCFLLPMTQYPGRENTIACKKKIQKSRQQVNDKDQKGFMSIIASVFCYFNPQTKTYSKRSDTDDQSEEERQRLNKKNE